MKKSTFLTLSLRAQWNLSQIQFLTETASKLSGQTESLIPIGHQVGAKCLTQTQTTHLVVLGGVSLLRVAEVLGDRLLLFWAFGVHGDEALGGQVELLDMELALVAT